MFMGDKMKLAGWFSILLPFAVFVLDLALFRGNVKKSHVFRKIILLDYIGVILYMTVLRRGIGTVHEINLHPFWSWVQSFQPDIRWQIYMNIFLFLPLGFFLGWCYEFRFWKTILGGFLFSTVIETTQYIFCLGLCEVDDVIHNTLGTVIGYGYLSALSFVSGRK